MYRRTRLFGLLDQAFLTHQTTWIAAPGGAGKTTLAGSYIESRKLNSLWYQVDAGDRDPATFFHYLALAAAHAAPRFRRRLPTLAPEYLGGVSAFARNFFRELCRRMQPPFVLVFDNVQEVPNGDALHEVLKEGLSQLPVGGHALLLSRAEPPEAFARTRVNQGMAELGWSEMRVTGDELQPLALVLGSAAPPSEIEKLYCRCDGWIAGLILLLQGSRQSPEIPGAGTAAASEKLFDYFAAEVFARRPAAVQKFLMVTALYPSFTSGMAERLTGYAHSRAVLNELVREHHFTERRTESSDSFQYHPLFREFLLERARDTLDAGEISHFRQHAATILEEVGDLEPASTLFLEAGNAESAARLILARAPELAAAGRLPTLAALIGRLPEQRIEHDPWLLYWRGTCRLMLEPASARMDFESAFAIFDGRGDPAGSYLSWAAVIDSFITEWGDIVPVDRWTAEFERLRLRYPEFPSPEVELRAVFAIVAALTNRHIYHPSLPPWLERAEQLMRNEVDGAQLAWWEVQLFWFFLWMGWMDRAEKAASRFRTVGDEERVHPLLRLTRRTNLATYHWVMGSPAEAIRQVEHGLRLSEEHGLVFGKFQLLGQGVLASLVRGDAAGAEAYLTRMAAVGARRGIDATFHDFLASATALHRGDLALAASLAADALELGRKCGSQFSVAFCLATSASAALLRRESDRAQGLIAELLALAAHTRSEALLLFGRVLDAIRILEQGDTDAAKPAVEQALALSRTLRGHAQPWLPHTCLARLYGFALRHEIETEHVKESIRRLGVASPQDGDLDGWPFAVRVFTLGRFTVLVDDEPLRFSTKAQKKPLELLKVLIALGGRRVLEGRLAEILWPQSEADSAALALTTTVHRLRKLIGEAAIERREGCLTLNPQRCWVDAWSIERQVTTLQRISQASASTGIAEAVERLLALYRGPFLADEREEFWVLSRRERLRGRFVRSMALASSALMEAHRHAEAIRYLEHCLEMDPLVEEFYRGIMQAHLAEGRHADVVDTYRRCRRMLGTHAGLEPSPDTEAVLRRIHAR